MLQLSCIDSNVRDLISLIDNIVFPSIAHEDITEVVDASGSSMVLNAASYVLSSQISEKVISILNMPSL